MKRYVHGWRGITQCVYGFQIPMTTDRVWQWIQPCTLKEAKRLKRTSRDKNDYVIYELVEVKPRKRKRG